MSIEESLSQNGFFLLWDLIHCKHINILFSQDTCALLFVHMCMQSRILSSMSRCCMQCFKFQQHYGYVDMSTSTLPKSLSLSASIGASFLPSFVLFCHIWVTAFGLIVYCLPVLFKRSFLHSSTLLILYFYFYILSSAPIFSLLLHLICDKWETFIFHLLGLFYFTRFLLLIKLEWVSFGAASMNRSHYQKNSYSFANWVYVHRLPFKFELFSKALKPLYRY